jgi:uncharacterized protein YeaO (DUF488 family)
MDLQSGDINYSTPATMSVLGLYFIYTMLVLLAEGVRMLSTRCILSKPESRDGFRISVMSRHTLNDGVTPDERIQPTCFDLHLSELGPSPGLIGRYVRQEIDWPSFAYYYCVEIQEPRKRRLVQFLAHAASHELITILCIEETAKKCHRRLLAEECQRWVHHLEVEHR